MRPLLPFSRCLSITRIGFRPQMNSDGHGSRLKSFNIFFRKLAGLAIALFLIYLLKIIMEKKLSHVESNISNAATVGMKPDVLSPTRRIVLEPGGPYPIESRQTNSRISFIKSLRSLTSKCQLSSRFGTATLNRTISEHSINDEAGMEKPLVAVSLLSSNSTVIDPILRTFLDHESTTRKSISIANIAISTCFSNSEQTSEIMSALSTLHRSELTTGCIHLCSIPHITEAPYTWIIAPDSTFLNNVTIPRMIKHLSCSGSSTDSRISVGEKGSLWGSNPGPHDKLVRVSEALGSVLVCTHYIRTACASLYDHGFDFSFESYSAESQLFLIGSALRSSAQIDSYAFFGYPNPPLFDSDNEINNGCRPLSLDRYRVVIAIHNIGDIEIFHDLIITFEASEMYELVIVLSSDIGIERLDILSRPALCYIHHLWNGNMETDRYIDLLAAWKDFLLLQTPVALIAVDSDLNLIANGAVNTAIAELEISEANLHISWIPLSVNDFSTAQWLSMLHPSALASWDIPKFTISVVVETSSTVYLQRLLKSLQKLHTYGTKILVDFHVESSADDVILKLVQDFTKVWANKGGAQIKFRLLPGGRLRSTTEAFYPNSISNHYGIILHSEMELSSIMFAWVKFMVLSYQYGSEEEYAADMYGISLRSLAANCLLSQSNALSQGGLATIGVSEQGTVENIKWARESDMAFTNQSMYFHQAPCGAGMVLFPEAWMEFRAYVGARLLEDNIVANIPLSDTNQWRTSWQRYLTEMVYQARYYMLYPNFLGGAGFALEGGYSGLMGQENSPQPPSLLEENVSMVDILGGRKVVPPSQLARFDAVGRVVDSFR